MHPDLSAELRNLQRQAEHLSQVARALAAATPVRSEGDDSTGCARVIVDPEGLPLEIRIVNHWQRLHDAESLSAAVLPPYSEFGDCPSAVDCGDASSVRDLLARVGFTGHRAIAYGDLK